MTDPKDDGEFSGPYARDPQPTLGDDYARDEGWSGGGRHTDYVREDDPQPQPDPHEHHDGTIGKASE